MYNSILLGIKQEKFRRYSEAFNFFQSKSINMIIGSRKLDYVVHYRDLEILDDETQYFKRYYSANETASRTRKLINYYELNMTPPSPNLLPVATYPLLETRHRKHIKLAVLREKQLAQQQDLEDDQLSEQMILSQLNHSNFSARSTEKQEDSQQDSYDSDPFNAYECEEESLKDVQLFQKGKSFDLINLKEIADSLLILDFKQAGEQHPHNIIVPPLVIPHLQKPEAVSIGIQTIVIEPARKIEKQSDQKVMPVPQLKKQSSLGLTGLRGELKRENMVLTDSMDMMPRRDENDKGKPSTFMEYYNSQPVKAPSNILERYIKRKK